MPNFRQILQQYKQLRDSALKPPMRPENDAQNSSQTNANFPVDPQDMVKDMVRRADPFLRMLKEIKGKFKNTEIVVNNKIKPSKLVSAELSAYTASTEETDENPLETSTGAAPREGITIATNDEDLIGKRVKYQGNIYTIEDKLGPRFRKLFKETGELMFDIFMEDKEKALEFGRKKEELIEILD